MRSTLKFGLVTGLISSIFLFGFFSAGVWLNAKYAWGMQVENIRGIGGLLSVPIQAIGIFMAMQDVKRINNSLTYGQALKTGVTVAVTIAVIVAIFGFLYCTVFNPGYADFMVKDAQKTMIAAGKSQQQINSGSAEVAKQFTPVMQVIQALVGQFFIGTIMSLIMGLFVKTKKQAI
jgi:hypothetical protein